MFFDPAGPPDSAASAGESGWASGVSAAREQAAADAPDTIDHLIEVADMMTVFAAQRLVQIHSARCEALSDAARLGRGLTEVVERSVRLEIAAALRITEHAAGEAIGLAAALVDRYPAVLDSFATARMTERHAQILIEAIDTVEPDLRHGILPRAIELAESQSVGSFRRALSRLVDTVRAATLAERHDAALQTRRIAVEHADDAMAWLHLFAPAVEVHAVFARATAIAKVIAAQDDETRTLDQIRSDVCGDLLIEGRTDAHPDDARGIRATVVITVPALTLLAGDDVSTSAPATVEGVGPIPITQARELCGGADGWMRVLTHPETGAVLSVGRELYRPPPALRRLVRWRADRCMAPGCGMPAARCEIDHTIAWEHGGSTSIDNTSLRSAKATTP